MSFEAKKEAALQELSQSGIWKVNYKPPALLLLWWLGLKARPFHYNGFSLNAVSLGLWFTVAWGALMWVMQWSTMNMPFYHVMITAVVAGCFFGLTMGIYFKRSAKKHGLSNWAQLSNDE